MNVNYGLLSIEILTACLAFGILIIGLIAPRDQRYGLGVLTSAGLFGILLYSFTQYGINDSLFNKAYMVDDYAVFFKQLFLAAALLVSMFSYKFVESLPGNRGEFFVMMIFATLGMEILASAGELITLYLGLELMTISFYVLTAYLLGNARSSEAGIKYLVLGALSSAVLLYGLSLLYGFTGTTIIADMADRLTLQPVVVLSVIFLVAGFGFKVSAVPFHMWSPDIYEGAPAPVTAFLAAGSKAAGFAIFVRVFMEAFINIGSSWVVLVAALAGITMIIGNLVAIPQTNVKRMLAYSSIAQCGYILVGLVAANEAGVKGVLFYAMIYVFANIGAFAVVTAVANKVGSDDIKDFSGLAKRSPLSAAVMTIALLSMAGIPPLSGFVGKFYLFSAVLDAGYIWLVFIGLVMSMISVYYYLSVARVMYLGEPVEDTPIPINGATRYAMLASMIITLIFGIYPAPLANLANLAARVLF